MEQPIAQRVAAEIANSLNCYQWEANQLQIADVRYTPGSDQVVLLVEDYQDQKMYEVTVNLTCRWQ